MQPLALSPDGHQLVARLEAASTYVASESNDTIHISGVGDRVYFAYEQLRNAAEYGERHLLVRRSIERYLRRNLSLRGSVPSDFGIQLIAEMTNARYLKNDSVPRSTVHELNTIANRYLKLGGAVRKAHSITSETLANWLYQNASVEIERTLVPQPHLDALVEFMFHHYMERIDREVFADVDDTTYELATYIGLHRSLLKSDVATIRYSALAARLGSQGSSLDYFVWLNSSVDNLVQAPLTNRLSRLINRYGAPMRILREVLLDRANPETLLADRGELMARINAACQKQYAQTRKRLNEGIIRSVLFIFITKVLIGVSIEVPYDLFTLGSIAWLPLGINLAAPPLYMAAIGLGLRTPSPRNTEVICSYLNRILYQTDDPALRYTIRKRVSSATLKGAFNAVYIIAFLVSFGIMVYLLRRLGFNLVNGTIFFVFISAVSFFGFRLLETAKELQIVEERRSLLSVLLDFFYTPFIRVGHWLSDKYSRINIVGFVLDLAIELPLKTSLKVIQQWAGFIRDKQDDL